MRKKLNITQAARQHGINASTWHRAVESGRIPPPTHRGDTPARLFYLEAEAAAAAKVFLEAHTQPEGTLSIGQAAELLGYCYTSVATYARRHSIGTKIWGRVWFDTDDYKKLMQVMGVTK